jgi:hypothetical protein
VTEFPAAKQNLIDASTAQNLGRSASTLNWTTKMSVAAEFKENDVSNPKTFHAKSSVQQLVRMIGAAFLVAFPDDSTKTAPVRPEKSRARGHVKVDMAMSKSENVMSTSAREVTSSSHGDSLLNLPPEVASRWIDSVESVAEMITSMNSLLEALGEPLLGDVESEPLECRNIESMLVIGMDTEWCEATTPSVVQLAVTNMTWVIDTKIPLSCEELEGASTHPRSDFISTVRKAIRAIFNHPSIVIVGWSFRHDLDKLCALIPDLTWPTLKKNSEQSWIGRNINDLQISVALKSKSANRISLKSACQLILGCTLDKSEQCSDWDRRPLTPSQLAYAALDAHCLLSIARELLIEVPS